VPSRKGSPNKLNAGAKENIAAVFTRLGGTAEMAKWAKNNQTEFYRLYGRLVPVEQNHRGVVGTYAALPIPVEARDSDSMASPAGPAANGHSAGHS